MPCTYCNVNFSIIKWKNRCHCCMSLFCTSCIVDKKCLPCHRILDSRWNYDELMKVKVKDLKLYANMRNLQVSACREKDELVKTIMLNATSQRRGAPTRNPNPSSSNSPHIPRFNEDFGENPTPINLPSGNTQSTQQTAPVQPFAQPPTYNRTQAAFPSAAEILNRESADSTPKCPTQNQQIADALLETEMEWVETPTSGSSASPSRPIPSGLNDKILIADIEAISQVELLSIRELKQILTDNFVDYKGCLEKAELRTKVINLHKDRSMNESKQAEQVPNTDEDDPTCKICWDRPIDCVLLECGHMVTCTQCGKRMNECPICRQYVVRCVHVFRT